MELSASNKRLYIDAKRCTGCLCCVTFCSLRKEGMVAPSRARIYVELEPFTGNYTPHLCVQCKEARCATACPIGAIREEESAGYWRIDYSCCIGCKVCIPACPFGAMFYDPSEERMIKCDTCGGEPICASICPTGALLWATPQERAEFRRQDRQDRWKKET